MIVWDLRVRSHCCNTVVPMPPQNILRLSDSAACSDLAFGEFTSFVRTQGEVGLGPACSNEEHITRLELYPRVLGTPLEHL